MDDRKYCNMASLFGGSVILAISSLYTMRCPQIAILCYGGIKRMTTPRRLSVSKARRMIVPLKNDCSIASNIIRKPSVSFDIPRGRSA